jgi:polyisoprenoid-binding protein YceI
MTKPIYGFLLFILLFIYIPSASIAQDQYMTRTGRISFHSDAPFQKIEAVNYSAISLLNISSGDVQVTVQIKSFDFEKPLMQTHFNENYMESDKFPKATFKGKITDIKNYDLTKDSKHNIEVTGELTMHGITQNIISKGTLERKADKILTNISFTVKPKDYQINIPAIVRGKIAETVEIRVDMSYEPIKK